MPAIKLARSTCLRDGRVMGYRCSASEASPWIDRANDAGRFTLEWHKAVNCTLVFGDVALGGEEAVALIVRILQAQRWRRDSALQRARRAARSMSSAGALPEDRRVPRIDVAGLETALTNDLGCGPSATAPRQGLVAYSFSSSFGCRVMRSFFLSMAALVVLMSPAISADKQALLYKAPVPAASAGNWTGCYIGGQADGLWGQSTKWIVRTQGALSPISRSAGMRWIAGAAARRPVATINLPAAM